jgi:hypothetical protein
MLFSGFVRNYIPPSKLFEELRDTGVLLPEVRLVSGRMRNPLLLIWIEGRGLQVFTLLNSHAGEESTYYGGLIRPLAKNAVKTVHNLSLHSLTIETSIQLDGAPCRENPLKNFIELSAGGSFFRSSRTEPARPPHSRTLHRCSLCIAITARSQTSSDSLLTRRPSQSLPL